MNTVCSPDLTIFRPEIGKSCMPSILIDKRPAAMSDTGGFGGLAARTVDVSNSAASNKGMWRNVITTFGLGLRNQLGVFNFNAVPFCTMKLTWRVASDRKSTRLN